MYKPTQNNSSTTSGFKNPELVEGWLPLVNVFRNREVEFEYSLEDVYLY